MYADLDAWLTLVKDDDWLAHRAESLPAEHEGDLEVSLVTVIELFLVDERFGFDRERAVTSIPELATYSGNADVLYQASANIDDRLNTFDAFHAAGSIISSDRAYDDLGGVRGVHLEPQEDESAPSAVWSAGGGAFPGIRLHLPSVDGAERAPASSPAIYGDFHPDISDPGLPLPKNYGD